MLLAPFQAVHAQGSNPPTPTLASLIQEYGLKPVNAIPDGVAPLQFDNPGELQSFLAKTWAGSHAPNHATYVEKGIGPNTGISPLSVSYTVVTRSCSVNVSLAKFNTWGDIRVGYDGSFRWIDSVLNTRTGLTGVTTGFTLSNAYSYSYGQTATSVSVAGGGVVNAYLLVNGSILLYSQPVSCSFTYRLY